MHTNKKPLSISPITPEMLKPSGGVVVEEEASSGLMALNRTWIWDTVRACNNRGTTGKTSVTAVRYVLA